MLSHRRTDKFSKIAGMNARIVLSWVDFWTVTLMWKNGQNETEHSTWMLLLTGKTVHRLWSELSVTPSGQKTKQSSSKHSTKYSQISYVFREIIRDCYCTAFTTFRCHCHSALSDRKVRLGMAVMVMGKLPKWTYACWYRDGWTHCFWYRHIYRFSRKKAIKWFCEFSADVSDGIGWQQHSSAEFLPSRQNREYAVMTCRHLGSVV